MKKWKCDSCGEKTKSPKFRVYDKKWNIKKDKFQCNECFTKNCI